MLHFRLECGKKIKSYSPESLKQVLNELLIADHETWLSKLAKMQKKPSRPTVKRTSQLSMQKAMEDSRSAALSILTHLNKLNNLLGGSIISRTSLDDYWNNPDLYLAAEHHLTHIRHFTKTIRDALSYGKRYDIRNPQVLIVNGLFDLLSLRLSNLRFIGNDFAHLHEVSSLNSVTSHGRRFGAYNSIRFSIDGFPYGGREGRPVNYSGSLISQLGAYIRLLHSTI